MLDAHKVGVAAYYKLKKWAGSRKILQRVSLRKGADPDDLTTLELVESLGEILPQSELFNPDY